MPSRGRLEIEMKKHGSLDQVQMIAKHNCYLFVYTNESYASAAAAALEEKAHLVWGISKVRELLAYVTIPMGASGCTYMVTARL